MSIEIKQLIIKSTLVSEARLQERSTLNIEDIESVKEQVMEECKEYIEQSLSEMQER
jgi:hypothetical protein